MATPAEQASPWLEGRSVASWREQFDRRRYLIFERVLSPDRVAEIRAALTPHLARDLKGRNDFEGVKTNRVYALLAKSPLRRTCDPSAGACVCRGRIGIKLPAVGNARDQASSRRDCAALALRRQWRENPSPRPALGISTFWAIDDTTELNGATEIIPGSHLWDGETIDGAVNPADFASKGADRATRRSTRAPSR